ncbi:MAG: DUF1501 domain-containing protein [Magnetospirillum sp.]|nr:DUF1501 domain-containing protein [Magnetospirillum sp.]
MRCSRRTFLAGTAALAAAPRLALAALPGNRRLMVVVLRGGLDGLHAVAPLGDPDYVAARKGLALESGLDLDGFFALHPALAPLVPLWRRRELAVVHAVASPYRERSHFDGQDILEGGAIRAHATADGWLARALGALDAKPRAALAVSQGMPLLLRGTPAAASWTPSPLPGLPPELVARIAALYKGDRLLAEAFEEGVQAEAMAEAALGDDMTAPEARKTAGRPSFPRLAEAAGRLLAAADGPRVAVLDLGGWDTHTNQAHRIVAPLGHLAEGLAVLPAALGPAWAETVVVAVGEFGRTVAANGTGGSDHGTGGALFLAGGAVAGGAVHGRWPGLATLHDGRDLAPTTDVRAVFKGVLKDHLGLGARILDDTVFPASGQVAPVARLVR